MSLNKSEALRIAEQRIHQGQTSEAIAIYKKIIEADPFDLTTIGALSNLYVKTGRIQDAIDDFSRIADGYLDKGSPIKSAYILKKILELDPRNAPAHVRLGEIYVHEGMSEKAYEAFLAAGTLFTKKGNLADALEANKAAVAADEAYIGAHKPSGPYPLAYYPHNLHFLVAAAHAAGDGKTALDAAAKLRSCYSRQPGVSSVWTQTAAARPISKR